MNSSAWKNTVVDFPRGIPTMITAEEKQYLYWLGSAAWRGEGVIVEIGPWLGGSTWCLAAGMHETGQRTAKRLVVYDNFIWRDFMSERAPLGLERGDCFHAEFLHNVSDFESIVDSYKRTLPDETITSDQDAQSKRYLADENVAVFAEVHGVEPVEILFVDGAKSWLGLKHLLLNVAGRLLPGRSMLVCQDFKYWGNYWVPMLVTFLREYLEPIHNVLSATTVTFRVVEPIPRAALEAWPDHIADVPTDAALSAIDNACAMLREHGDVLGAANVQLGTVMFLSHQDKAAGAADSFRKCQANWPPVKEAAQLERARKYLAESRSIDIAPTLATRAIRLRSRASQLARRVAKRILKPQQRG